MEEKMTGMHVVLLCVVVVCVAVISAATLLINKK